uniref:Uncharacterized protein n=1 Tax=Oryza meridionalis TaxID=40149 RepID=A0A0E0EA45_9ORYZ
MAAAAVTLLDLATKTEWQQIDGDLRRRRLDAEPMQQRCSLQRRLCTAKGTQPQRLDGGGSTATCREENQKMMEPWMRVPALAARSRKARSASATGGLRAAGIGQGRAGVMETVRHAAMEIGSRG